MFDTQGDGWNNGTLLVSSGGVVQSFSFSGTVGNGFDTVAFVSVQAGFPLVLAWSAGAFDNEVSFVLYDNDGEVLFSASNPKAGILFFLPSATCYTCLRPVLFWAENVWDTRARLAWTPSSGGNAATQWQVIYGPAGFDPTSSAAATVVTPLPRVTLTGLKPYTEYDAYVRQYCVNNSLSRLRGPLRFRTYRTNDVGISAILTPQSSCSLGIETITVVLRNYGAAPQTLIPFNFSVNGTPAGVPQPQDGFYTGILGKDSLISLAFETTYDFSQSGEYLITAWTELKGDEDPSNDTFRVRIVNRAKPPYFQDFEEWEGGWTVSGQGEKPPTWQWGVPNGKTISRAGSGQKAWVTGLTGNYNNLEYSYLESPCFDFSALKRDPVIEFLLQFDTEEGYDGAWLEVSVDEDTAWSKVGNLDDDIHWYTHLLGPEYEKEAWSGRSEGWVLARYPLTGTAGKSKVRLRFVFKSDLLATQEGVGLDAIRIYEPEARDVAALRVYTAAASTLCGNKEDRVILEVANFGYQPLTFYRAAYLLPGKPAVEQQVGPSVIEANKVTALVFAQPFNSWEANFPLRAWVEVSGDAQPSNDSAQVLLQYQPLPLPLYETFESGSLPKRWVTNGTLTKEHGNTSLVLSANLYSSEPSFHLITDRYGPIQPGDSLSFEYRITDYNSDGKVGTVLMPGTFFELLVSDDCGDSYSTLYVIDHKNHIPTTTMRTVRLSMAPYVGRSVILRMEGVWSAGDFYFDLDNIRLTSRTTVSVPEPSGVERWTFALWPNPTSGFVQLQGEGPLAEQVHIHLFDAVGRLWAEYRLTNANYFSQVLDLQNLPSGLYGVRITLDGQPFTYKLLRY
ncbi:MAG: T9SS type A sorting domain-containing protein [Saprospiraceae bacterium]|nr:T9SS type A sorting domain-containing protein [Saprospiraceae bacterium]MDW8482709.1 T9SS type A sorting domain-containing protein [Saprospiraceae bacterium]